MDLLKKLLEERGIQPIEAGGSLAPAQSAFCAKICSKIITSQFCIALLNNDEKDGIEIPNANVNMEYGIMLGFNKYVIPFQKDSQKLLLIWLVLTPLNMTIRILKTNRSVQLIKP